MDFQHTNEIKGAERLTPPNVHYAYGGFFGDLILKYIDGRRWEVINDDERKFGYQLPDREEANPVRGRRLVPAHRYITDLASTHFRIIRWLLPSAGDGPRGAYGPAAVAHDWAYRTHQVAGIEISRKLADKIFYWGMKGSGVANWRCRLMYAAVRVGAWKAWRD